MAHQSGLVRAFRDGLKVLAHDSDANPSVHFVDGVPEVKAKLPKSVVTLVSREPARSCSLTNPIYIHACIHAYMHACMHACKSTKLLFGLYLCITVQSAASVPSRRCLDPHRKSVESWMEAGGFHQEQLRSTEGYQWSWQKQCGDPQISPKNSLNDGAAELNSDTSWVLSSFHRLTQCLPSIPE